MLIWKLIRGSGVFADVCLISDSISNPISDPISSQLCNHLHGFPHDCLCDYLVDHLHLITGKLCDQLRISNSDIAEAQDPGLSLQEAMAKDRRIMCSLIIQCCTACMYILILSPMTGPYFSLWISPSSGEIP